MMTRERNKHDKRKLEPPRRNKSADSRLSAAEIPNREGRDDATSGMSLTHLLRALLESAALRII